MFGDLRQVEKRKTINFIPFIKKLFQLDTQVV